MNFPVSSKTIESITNNSRNSVHEFHNNDSTKRITTYITILIQTIIRITRTANEHFRFSSNIVIIIL